MKKLIYLLFVAGLFSCSTPNNQLTMKNPMDTDRPDETILIERVDLEQKFGKIEAGLAPVLKRNGQLVPTQADDMDGDGYWDELVVNLDFLANETITLQLEFIAVADYPDFEKRTNVRLGIVQEDHSFKEVDQYFAPQGLDGFPTIAQGESVNWENDKMGFRNYFDCRNVKDLFGKLQPGLIIDKIHTPEMGDYHKLADWGMDVLHCGSSLGSGGLAMLENDSLFRLGSTDVYEYQKVVEGPIRSVFDLKYKGWDVAGQKLDAVERISIYPGKYWFQSDVTVTGYTGQKQLATGIVTSLLKNEPYSFDAGKNFAAIATLDVQSLNQDELGMAVMVPKDELTAIDRTTDINFFKEGYQTVPAKNFSHVISETYYVAQKLANEQPARHYFFAVWGLENPKWKEIDHFKSYINEEAEKLSHPIDVII
ncbi:DUF4861 domain-containing protein [uncultured Sunxiuqinia sp.]|uniref:DUF4861 domain-containing protein n=1 Tax=uncultured Sunxiuqinia sp. TaxID=1573825 RepID=UPI00260334CF|nr:DUF4861 domain-containing protein [uncultured Sunxiuqinia sp.]